MSQTVKIKIAAGLLGGIAMTMQIVLLRSFLAVFYGNELLCGMVLAVWLVWSAFGSWAGNRIAPRFRDNAWPWLFIILCFIIIWIIGVSITVKFIRIILTIPSGEIISTGQFIFFAIPLMAPCCIAIGFSFTLLAQIYSNHCGLHKNPAAHIYIYEAIGSVVGSLLFTFVLVRLFSFSHQLILTFLLFSLCVTILWLEEQWRALFFTIAIASCALMPLMVKIELLVERKYWSSMAPQMRLIDHQTSRYGELAVVDWAGEKVLFSNSIKQTSLTDAISAQANAALVMNQHADPKKILLISGGLGGLAPELSHYSNTHVDYAEIDGQAFNLVMQHLSQEDRMLWQQPNLRILHEDGRRYLQRSPSLYDVIIIDVGRPTSAWNNRYYSEEFFSLVRTRLKSNGLFAICGFPSAENYLGAELLQLNAAVYRGLKKYFAQVLILPGDEAIFLAAVATNTLLSNPAQLSERMQSRDIKSAFFYPSMFAQYMPTERMAFIERQLSLAQNVRPNRDFAPIAYYFDLVLWHKMIYGAAQALQLLQHIGFVVLLGLWLIILLMVFIVWFRRREKRASSSLLWNSASFGFAGMGFNIMFLLALQNIFGYIFEGLGLAMAAFMGGMAAASWLSQTYIHERAIMGLRLIAIATILATLSLPSFFNYLQTQFSLWLFFLAILFAGALIGLVFPLLCHSYEKTPGRHRWGTLYATDLAGGAIGSLLLSVFFIPLFGFGKSCLFIGVNCMFGLLLLLYTNFKNLEIQAG